jgi:cardiolipin synthase
MGKVSVLGSVLIALAVSASAFAKTTSHSHRKHKPRPPIKEPVSGTTEFGEIEVTKLIVMPETAGHTDFIDAIASAKSSVHMTMYHITDNAVVNALIAKAKDKKIDLRVIVDGNLSGGYRTVFNNLTAAGVKIRAGSTAFSLTHSKDVVIDGKTAIISAINMTNTFSNSRDFGIVTTDASIISEVESVFATDWQNAQDHGNATPPLSNPNLIWSPTTSTNLLVKLIDSSKSTLVAETESFDDSDVINALNRAAARGVVVRLIVPECNLGNALMNYPHLAQLQDVKVHVEHDGNTDQQPYMHSKMMMVDGKTMYIGSINYSFNSTQKDRELGVIFANANTASDLSREFETDWNRSQMPSAKPACTSGWK